MKGKISKGGIKPSWGLLLLIVMLLILVSIAPVRATTVTTGYIYYGSFPYYFPTAREHPYDREDYLMEGEMGQVIVAFRSTTGTGLVTLNVSSDAFAAGSSLTKNITKENIYYTFKLTFNLKSGIDGPYMIHFQATNEAGDILDGEAQRIEVWCEDRKEAADALYATEDVLYSIMYYRDSPAYESPEARSNYTAAINEFALAQLAYSNKNWMGAKTHADNTIEWINKAESAEKEVIKLKEGRLDVAKDVNLKIIDFLGWMTYPALIIAVLAMAYIVVAIFKKIQPLPKPK